MRILQFSLFAVLLLVGTVGFADEEMSGGATEDKLTDATIISIFDDANTADIITGRIGATKGHSDEVKALGRMVATDHVHVQNMGRELANKLGVIPVPPDGDQSIINLAQVIKTLQSKSGPDFDLEYLMYEIGYHQAVIDAIDNVLLPETENEELRALIIKVRPGFEGHLAATKAAAKKLGYLEEQQ